METVRKVVVWKAHFALKWWPILLALWSAFWFAFIFEPLEQSDAFVRSISPTTFEYSNVSRKPFPSELICRIEDSVLVVATNRGTDYQRNQRQDNWGTGVSDWTTWKVRGVVPFAAEAIVVHKELTYRCLGFFFKKSITPEKILDVKAPY